MIEPITYIEGNMLRFKDNKFIPFSLLETDLKNNGLLERTNLQKAIIDGWQAFTKEIKIPDLQFIGQEVIPDDRIKDRIDILAFDPNDNIPVIIELKRDRNKFQLLQGISYAAMTSSWNSEKFIQEAKNQKSVDFHDIENTLSDLDLEGNIRIILISEKFDPEVIITANWLYEHFGMDVLAISINVFKVKEELYFIFEQKYPLPELHESYDLRGGQRKKESDKSEKTWEEIATTFKYKWGEELLQRCRKEKEGNPDHKRILNFRSNFGGFKWITLHFQINFVNVYMKGKPEDVEKLFQSTFQEKIELNSWRDGYSFHITTQSQYEDLCSWLGIKKVA